MSLFVRKPPAYTAPGDCLLAPGRRADDDGWIDPGIELDGVRGPLRPMISAEGFRQAARRHPQLRLVDAGELELSRELLRAAQDEIAELREYVDRLQAESDAISGLRKAGFIVQKVKGPRPREDV